MASNIKIIMNIVTNIIALTICKYTLPKNFINNNFNRILFKHQIYQ